MRTNRTENRPVLFLDEPLPFALARIMLVSRKMQSGCFKSDTVVARRLKAVTEKEILLFSDS